MASEVSPDLHTPHHPFEADEAIAILLQQFLDEWHYCIIKYPMGHRWRGDKTLKVALDVLRMNGLPLQQEEYGTLAAMQEEELVQTLVERMPLSMRRNFEQLTLQLKMVANLTGGLRLALESGNVQELQDSIEDSSGIQREIVKNAVVRASHQVLRLRQIEKSWRSSMEKRLQRLLHHSESAAHAHQQLMAIESQLDAYNQNQKSSAKSTLMNMASGNDKNLLHSSFSSWRGLTLKNAAERSLRNKFEQQIAEAEKKLFDYKEKQLTNVKGVLMRKAAEGDECLLAMCWKVWFDSTEEARRDGEAGLRLGELETRRQTLMGGKRNSTMKVMSAMTAGKENGMLEMCLKCWQQFSIEYKRDRETEEQVKRLEAQMNAHMKESKESAKGVLSRMTGATDTGLMSMAMTGWVQWFTELKKAQALQEQLEAGANRFKMLNDRQKGSATQVQGRVNDQINMNLLLRVFALWVLEARLHKIEKVYGGKLDSKRRQLSGIQTLFKSFATQLEAGLGSLDGDSSGRVMSSRSKSNVNIEKRPSIRSDGMQVSFRSTKDLIDKPGSTKSESVIGSVRSMGDRSLKA